MGGPNDIVQKSDKSYYKFNDVTTPGVLEVEFSKPGNGTLTRQAEKVFRVTYPAGKGIAPDRTSYAWSWHAPGDHTGLNVAMTTNTELVKEFTITDTSGETTVNISAELTISEVQGD